MPLEPLAAIDTRRYFRPVASALVNTLRALPEDAWNRATVAGSWRVRDVVAHLIDTAFRRLSFHRDRMTPAPPSKPIESPRDFVEFINELNAQWVIASKRLSPRVLTDLYDVASSQQADWFESVPLDAPALFAVSWAGEHTSPGWFDIGREFTEVWHHQQQIRMAIGADGLDDSRYLAAVIDVSLRGLPHAFREVTASIGDTVVLDVSGSAGGQWTLLREDAGWTLWRGSPPSATTRVQLEADAAWRLLFNALAEPEAASAVRVDGRSDLARPLLRARSVVV